MFLVLLKCVRTYAVSYPEVEVDSERVKDFFFSIQFEIFIVASIAIPRRMYVCMYVWE